MIWKSCFFAFALMRMLTALLIFFAEGGGKGGVHRKAEGGMEPVRHCASSGRFVSTVSHRRTLFAKIHPSENRTSETGSPQMTPSAFVLTFTRCSR